MGTESFSKSIFEKVFTRDVHRLCGMEDMWKTRKPPSALDYDKIKESAGGVVPQIANMDQKLWTVEENFAVFVDSLQRLSKRAVVEAKTDENIPIMSFDKDDVDTLDFVAAAANLRCSVFGIELKSKFDIKRKFPSPKQLLTGPF